MTSLLEVLSFIHTMVGGDEVQVQEGNFEDETQGQQLTYEEIKEIKEVDTKEEADVLVVLLKKTIDTIMIEEFFETNSNMNQFRHVLAQGVFRFAEDHAGDTAKLDLFVDAFRAAWKVDKEGGDETTTMDVFMREMDNELWVPPNSKDKEV